jgi:hypothetical protein
MNPVTSNELRVLKIFVENGRLKEYDLVRKFNVNPFFANRVPKKLFLKGLLRYDEGGVSRAGREVRFYYPSFRGYLTYFASLREDVSPRTMTLGEIEKGVPDYSVDARKSLRKAIETAACLYPQEKIFTEWDSLERYFDIVVYVHLCYAASEVLYNPQVFPPGYEAKDLFLRLLKNRLPQNTLKTLLEKLGPSNLSFEVVVANLGVDEVEQYGIRDLWEFALKASKEDYAWMLSFEIAFVNQFVFDFVYTKLWRDYDSGSLKPVPNQKLYNFFTGIIDSEIVSLRERVELLIKTREALRTLFGTLPKNPLKPLDGQPSTR